MAEIQNDVSNYHEMEPADIKGVPAEVQVKKALPWLMLAIVAVSVVIINRQG